MAKIEVDLQVNLKKATKSIDNFSKQAAKNFSFLKLSAASFVGSFTSSILQTGLKAISNGLKSLVSLTSEATRLSAIQEEAVNELNTALKLTGKFSKEASQGLQQFASELQQASIFGDELILTNIALLQNLGQLDTKGLKRATQASVNLASALNISLNAAILLVGKAAAGEIGSFSRYGLIIKKGATAAESFANTLEILEGRFTGAALAKVDTFAGAQAQLANTIGDTKEKFGDIITQSPIVIELIKTTGTQFVRLGEAIAGNKDRLQELVKDGIIGFLQVIPGLASGLELLNNAFFNTEKFVRFFVLGLQTIGASVGFVIDTLTFLQTNVEELFLKRAVQSLEALEKEKEQFEERKVSISEFRDFLVEITDEQIENINKLTKAREDSVQGEGKVLKKSKKQLSDWEKFGSQVTTKFSKTFKAAQADNVGAVQSSLSSISTLQSSENKKLFRIGQAAALSNAFVSVALGVTRALGSSPPPLNFILAGLVATAGAVQIGTIASQTPPSSARDGIDFIPEDNSTFLASRGERVVGARLNEDLRTFLKAQGEVTEQTPTTNVFNIEVSGQIGDSDETALALADAVTNAFENLNATRGEVVA